MNAAEFAALDPQITDEFMVLVDVAEIYARFRQSLFDRRPEGDVVASITEVVEVLEGEVGYVTRQVQPLVDRYETARQMSTSDAELWNSCSAPLLERVALYTVQSRFTQFVASLATKAFESNDKAQFTAYTVVLEAFTEALVNKGGSVVVNNVIGVLEEDNESRKNGTLDGDFDARRLLEVFDLATTAELPGRFLATEVSSYDVYVAQVENGAPSALRASRSPVSRRSALGRLALGVTGGSLISALGPRIVLWFSGDQSGLNFTTPTQSGLPPAVSVDVGHEVVAKLLRLEADPSATQTAKALVAEGASPEQARRLVEALKDGRYGYAFMLADSNEFEIRRSEQQDGTYTIDTPITQRVYATTAALAYRDAKTAGDQTAMDALVGKVAWGAGPKNSAARHYVKTELGRDSSAAVEVVALNLASGASLR